LQDVHCEAFSDENKSAGQSVHPNADSNGLNVPGWQLEQTPDPEVDIMPAGQL
jgi:hypothetical protein